MRTLFRTTVLLLAACVAPRIERSQPDSDQEPPDDAPAWQEPAKCTRQNPCTLDVVAKARNRVALEADVEDKIVGANANAQTKRVADHWMQTLARSIAEERDHFSEWCRRAQAWSATRRKSGAPGLTSEDMFRFTGQPTSEMEPESSDGSTENEAWTWDFDGPLSRTVSFVILFMRPAGSDGPRIFAGCQWCASGGPATSPGCVQLPVKQ